MLVCVPLLAHDPKRDEHDHAGHQTDHSLEDRREASRSVDLATVRSLVITFRESGDDRSLDEAWALLEPAIESETRDPETLIVAAFVAQSRHEFIRAVHLIRKALEINENNDEGWLLLASIHLVRGETEPAATACARLRMVSPLVILTCKARIALALGDHRLALTGLQRVLSVLGTERSPVDSLAWSYSVAGDLAVAAGESWQATGLYQRSLGFAERTQVRAALVDVLLSEADYEAAWRALDGGAPALPLLVRRLIAAKRLNRVREYEPVVARVQQEFEAWISNEDWLHAREMARFFIDVVDRPDLARQLAVINLSRQQEPEDQRLERRTRS